MFKLSEQTNELFTALSKCQGELDNASKLKQAHGYKYADLAECISIAKAPLAANGLAVSQLLTQSQTNKQALVTILTHSSGQYMMSEFDLADATLQGQSGKNPVQLLGSAITYQRRYAYTAILGIAQQDDDAANCSVNNNNSKSYLLSKLRKAINEKGYTCEEVERHVKLKLDEMDESGLNSLNQSIAGWSKKVA